MSIARCDDSLCNKLIDTDKEEFNTDKSDRIYCIGCGPFVNTGTVALTPGNAVEQAEAALADLAGLAGTFYKELIDKGVDGVLAHDLVVNYMSGIFAGAQGREVE